MATQCPNCHSYKTITEKAYAMIGVVCLGGMLSFVFLFIFFPLSPVILIASIFFFVVAAMKENSRTVCMNCQNKFIPKGL